MSRKDTRPYLQRKVIFKSERLVVTRDKARLHGRVTEKIWTWRPRVAAMIILRDPDTLVLVRQYRYGANRNLWELTAGTIDPGESPRACAIRECQEETGWIPGKVRSFGSYISNPAGSDERTYLYILSNLKKGEAHPDPGEELTVREFSRAQIKKMLKNGQICDAKSIIGLHRYLSPLK